LSADLPRSRVSLHRDGVTIAIKAQANFGATLVLADSHQQAFLIQYLPFEIAVEEDCVWIPHQFRKITHPNRRP